jgi:hypothetical protein
MSPSPLLVKYHDGIVFHAAYFDAVTRRSGGHVLSVAVTRPAPAVIAVMFVGATVRVIDAGWNAHYRLGATYSPIPQVVAANRCPGCDHQPHDFCPRPFLCSTVRKASSLGPSL